MPALHKEVRLLPQSDVRYRPMPRGGMLVNLTTGACFELNRVGADLWARLAEGRTVGSAIETIRDKYDAGPDVIESDALRLCAELLNAGLVERTTDGKAR